MDKIEPLKNKVSYFDDGEEYKRVIDIKLAVKWLKCEFDCRYEHGASKKQLLEAIDMAFWDILKNSRN